MSDAGTDESPSSLAGCAGDLIAAPQDEALPRRWLALLALTVAVIRFGFGSQRRIYDLLPDEAGMVAMSRWFAGRSGFDMFDSSTWQPGLSLLHAPISRFVDDPSRAYQLGLLLLAVIAGVSAVVLALVVHRVAELGPLASIVTSAFLALTPAGMSSTAFFWAEALVWLAFLGSLATTLRYFDRRSSSAAISAVGASVAGYAAHGRLLPLALAIALIIAAHLTWQRRYPLACVVLVTCFVGVGVVGAGSRWVFHEVWTAPGTDNTASATLSNLGRPLDVLDAFVGQLWYLLVASVGLFGVGVFVLVRSAAGQGPHARDARVVLTMVGSMMAASAVFLAGRNASSFPIYGRYNDVVSTPVVAVGAGWLLRRGRLPGGAGGTTPLLATAAVTMALGTLVSARHGDAIAEHVTAPMVAGVVAYVGDNAGIDVVWVSVASAVIGSILLCAASVRHRLGTGLLLAAVILLLAVGAARFRTGSTPLINSAMRAENVVTVLEIVDADEPFGVLFVDNDVEPRPNVALFAQRRRVFVYQFFLVGRQFEEVRAPTPNDDVQFIFAPVDDSTMIASGATPVWQDPVILMALWREAGARGAEQETQP